MTSGHSSGGWPVCAELLLAAEVEEPAGRERCCARASLQPRSRPSAVCALVGGRQHENQPAEFPTRRPSITSSIIQAGAPSPPSWRPPLTRRISRGTWPSRCSLHHRRNRSARHLLASLMQDRLAPLPQLGDLRPPSLGAAPVAGGFGDYCRSDIRRDLRRSRRRRAGDARPDDPGSGKWIASRPRMTRDLLRASPARIAASYSAISRRQYGRAPRRARDPAAARRHRRHFSPSTSSRSEGGKERHRRLARLRLTRPAWPPPLRGVLGSQPS